MEITQTDFSNLVLLSDKKEPYTLSTIISDNLSMEHHSITRIIRKHEADFKEFGKILTCDEINGFKIHKLNSVGRPVKVYILNEEQATLLVTYLKNTKLVREFKKMLVREFYKLRDEVNKFKIERELEKPVRKSLTQAIKKWSYNNKWAYKNITDLLLTTIVGKNAKQLTNNKNITAYDVLTSEQLAKYKKLENQVISLLELNFTYGDIKKAIKKEPHNVGDVLAN